MTPPLIEQQDPEKVVTDYLYQLIQTQSAFTGWTVGTVVAPGTTPSKAIRVRAVGGVPEQRVADRPLVDVRLWTDGTIQTEGTAKRNARILLAHMRRDGIARRVVANPIALPDPADASKTHVLFTIELLTRGVQTP